MKPTLLLMFLSCVFLVACGGDDDTQDTMDDGPCQGFGCPSDDNNQDSPDAGEQDPLDELPWTPQDTTVSWTSLEDRPCPEDNTLTWDNFGGPIMLNWCAGCHHSELPAGERAGAPVGVDMESPELVRAQLERIWARSADDNLTMPPVGGPDEMQRFYLGQWLACGAP